MAPADREHLSSIDTAWYRLESDSNHANIGGVLIFDEPLDFDRVRSVIDERFVGLFPRFRQRVVESTGRLARPYWEDVPDFDLDDHIHRMTLPEPGDRRVLQEVVGDVMTDALAMDRPLWQIYQIDNYEGGSVLLAQLHHCLGDGFALARVLMSLADEGHGLEAPAAQQGGESAEAHRSIGDWILEGVRQLRQGPEARREVFREVIDFAAELGHIVFLPFAEKTRLKRPHDGQLQVAWSETFELDDLKAIAHEIGYTLNDILMAAVTDAVRQLLVGYGEAVDEFDLRAIVPVNLRPARSIEEMEAVLGNEFGLVFLELPIHASDPDERLATLKANIDALKESPEAAVAFGILCAEGIASGPVEHLINEIFARKASLVVSNVPGPKRELRIAGRPLKELMFWVPHPAPDVGLGISLISYAGRVSIGVRADTAVVDDPGELVEAIETSFESMKRWAR